MAIAAGAGAAVSGCHPTTTAVLDPLYAAVFGALVALAGAVSARGALLWMAAVGLAMSRGQIIFLAAAALLLVLADVLVRRPSRLLGALSAGTTVQVLLRWHPLGFNGLTAIAGAVAVLPLLVASVAWLPRRMRRVVVWTVAGLLGLALLAAVPVVIEGLLSRQAISRGTTEARSALKLVEKGEAPAATAELDRATADFGSASQHLDSVWTQPARAVPLLAQQRQVLAVVSGVAQRISDVAKRDAAGIDFSQFRFRNGAVDFHRVEALQAPLSSLQSSLLWGQRRIASVRSPWTLAPIASRVTELDSELGKAETSSRLAASAVSDAPSLLGVDATRHYFVIFDEPAESRGLGGLLLWYAELTVDNGRISIGSFGDAHKLADQLVAQGGGHLSGPASYLARYGRFDPQNTFIDLTYSPDLPTVTDVISQLYSQLGHPPIDGVLVLDPKSLASIIGLTGPLPVPGLGTLTGANTVEVLDREQYALYPAPSQYDTRKAVLYNALRLASHRLTSASMVGFRQLLDGLGPDVTTGDLLFWSVHPGDQPLLSETGLAGRFPDADGGDLVSVVTQNAANNKIDAYLQRTIDDSVTYDPATGAVSSRVSVTLHNSAPASGLSEEVIGSYAGSGLPPGSDLLWFSLYSPLKLERASVAGSSTHLTEVGEFGLNTYSGYIRVPSGASRTVTFDLTGVIRPGPDYRLTLHEQPTVLPDKVRVQVTAVKGWSTGDPDDWTPPHALNSFAVFPFRAGNR